MGQMMDLETAEKAASAVQNAGPVAGFFASAWWKLAGWVGGFGIAAGLAAFIAMCMTRPRDDKEWRVALASTLAVSVFGGAAFIRYFGIQGWANDWIGAVGLLGVVFACGLPGWAIVRWTFNFIQARQDKGLDEIADEVRRQLGAKG